MPHNLLTSASMLASSTLVAWNALVAHGHDAEAVFLQAGLDPSKFKDEDARFPADSITQLHETIIATTGDPCFMLKLADHWHPSHLHALGYGWLASTSLKEAFDRLIRYYAIAAISAECITFEKTSEGYLYDVLFPQDLHPLHETEEDSLLVVVLTMCRISAGASFNPLRVRVRRPAPLCASEFHDYFGTAVEFGSDASCMLLPAAQIEMELPTANSTLARACDQIIHQYLSRLDRAHVINKVRTRLVEVMPSGRLSEEAIARSLHLSIRSLQRRLKQEGTTFKFLVEDTRKALAHSYIRDKHTSIGEITYLLGYSDPANFSRAYKRWTGMTPTENRARL